MFFLEGREPGPIESAERRVYTGVSFPNSSSCARCENTTFGHPCYSNSADPENYYCGNCTLKSILAANSIERESEFLEAGPIPESALNSDWTSVRFDWPQVLDGHSDNRTCSFCASAIINNKCPDSVGDRKDDKVWLQRSTEHWKLTGLVGPESRSYLIHEKCRIGFQVRYRVVEGRDIVDAATDFRQLSNRRVDIDAYEPTKQLVPRVASVLGARPLSDLHKTSHRWSHDSIFTKTLHTDRNSLTYLGSTTRFKKKLTEFFANDQSVKLDGIQWP
jgi:hypothetical protein